MKYDGPIEKGMRFHDENGTLYEVLEMTGGAGPRKVKVFVPESVCDLKSFKEKEFRAIMELDTSEAEMLFDLDTTEAVEQLNNVTDAAQRAAKAVGKLSDALEVLQGGSQCFSEVVVGGADGMDFGAINIEGFIGENRHAIKAVLDESKPSKK